MNELAAAVHENAVAHGWWEQERNCRNPYALRFRSLRRLWKSTAPESRTFITMSKAKKYFMRTGEACEKHERRKPEGVAVELADCMIRILDYCGHAGIDIEEAIRIKHEYNKTRPYRHGGRNVDRGSRAAGIALCKRSVRAGCAGLQEPFTPNGNTRPILCRR